MIMSVLKKKSAQRVQEALMEKGVTLSVIEFDASTRTSVDAANAIGCDLGQIAKSLIFKGKESGKPILIIASGTNRVNEKKMKEVIGEKLSKADAAFVLEETGYAIGGIPPIGHLHPIQTWIDQDLLNYEVIWAAAGTPNAVFELNPSILLDITKGKVVSVN
jgi:prolyl-tRNA editing enzyme YbaK/EbsC (Cys-tRNA(Pro) deacylase)